ncbi:FYV10 [Candida margitis]|uniref:FYV10 n=1 Tax=Candida margitis TaxID=1775924 RepID=UPI0022262548|nr:FYV10 [Candida margitis]KAI5969796.1 FYV10 [Candida margitis]
MTEPTIDFHIQTHQPQFNIPTQLIKKNFKSIQKLIEKQKKQTSDEITKIKKNSKLPTKIQLEMIRKLINNFETFQKKLQVLIKKDEEYRLRLVARLENIVQLSNYCINGESSNLDDQTKGKNSDGDTPPVEETNHILNLHNPNLINWYRNETNLLIIDYLIKSNTNDTENLGLKLLESLSKTNPKLSRLIDFDLFLDFNKVYLSITKAHDLSLIINWFNENKNSLKKINSNLEFEINYCKYLTLIEVGDVNEAIKFSQDNLSSYGNKDNYSVEEMGNYKLNSDRLKGLGGLLVYRSMSSNPLSNMLAFSNKLMFQSQPYREYEKLLSNQRWEDLGYCFIDNFIKLYGITNNYPLFVYLSAGLSSLKTKSCYHNNENTVFKDDSMETSALENTVPHNDYHNGSHNGFPSTQTPILITSAKFNSYTAPTPTTTTTSNPLTIRKFRGPDYYYRLLHKVNNCPVCSPEMFQLSRNLPFAQLITSIFNNPFRLPNGNIYPFDKLLSTTVNNDEYFSEQNTLLRQGQVKDPLTHEVFYIDNCIRVFPA